MNFPLRTAFTVSHECAFIIIEFWRVFNFFLYFFPDPEISEQRSV